jgi:hypothetical protein
MRKATGFAAIVAAGITGSALALPSTVQIGVGGGDLGLRAFDFSSTVFGNSAPGQFTTAALGTIHATLNGAGITTANWITVVAGFVDTNHDQVADETALFWLIDDQVTFGPSGPDATIDFQSGINKTSGSAAWINDVGDNITVDDSAPGFDKIAYGDFAWDNDGFADGFAWSGLATNDTGNFRFLNPNWTGFQGIQFVSYDATSNSWSVLEQITGSGALQQFSFTVISLPPAALMGLAGIAGLGVLRRRMA